MTVDDSSPVKPRPYRVQLRRTKGWRKPAPERHSAAVRFFDEFEALPRLVTP